MTQTKLKIALIGYGKMGQTIEQLAIERGHTIVAKYTSKNPPSKKDLKALDADAAIEFTRPDAVLDNIKQALGARLPIVVGTTGWENELQKITDKCLEKESRLIHASNFSVGVNMLFEINRKLAKLMNAFPEYAVEIEETHHTQKLDAPSGTAISLANDIVKNVDGIESWRLSEGPNPGDDRIPITALLKDDVKGIHHVTYTSGIDQITISHEAFTRDGFALGSILAAEFLVEQKPGVYTMKDYFKSL